MPDPNFLLLYVASPARSAAFYADLLGRAPLEASPTFALFSLNSATSLGLWSRDHVEPAATPPGGSELAWAVGDVDTVNLMHATWCAKGLSIAQPPKAMDFGCTFVALDPDGHRLRVFAPGGA